eukprot:m.45776 g.45776  ORF g.45776 m.45776 type:complete len:639 (-) comp8682_c0_seq2:43-1959(-)
MKKATVTIVCHVVWSVCLHGQTRSNKVTDGSSNEELQAMVKQNRALRKVLDNKCEAQGARPVTRDIHQLRVQQAMLRAEKRQLQATLVGGDKNSETLRAPHRAKSKAVELEKSDIVARAISLALNQRANRSTRKIEPIKSESSPVQAPTVPPTKQAQEIPAPQAESEAEREADAAELAAKKQAIVAARREQEAKLRQLEAEERALEAAAKTVPVNPPLAASAPPAAPKAKLLVMSTPAPAAAVAVPRENPPKAKKFVLSTNASQSTGSEIAAPPSSVTQPSVTESPTEPLARGVSERDRRRAEADSALTNARLAEVTFDFSFGAEPGDSPSHEPTGASTSPTAESEAKARKRHELAKREVELQLERAKIAANDEELGQWHGDQAPNAEWTTQSEMNKGSVGGNDERILQAIARTNPDAYKEARLATLARGANSKEARAQRQALLAAERELVGEKNGSGLEETDEPKELVLSEPDYLLSMITSGLSEDSELTGFDGVRYHMNSSGQRVVREGDRVRSPNNGSSTPFTEDTLRRREQNRAAVEERKVAAQQRKQDAWLRSLKRGQGRGGQATSGSIDQPKGRRSTSGYTPEMQAKLHDMFGMSREKTSELGANSRFLARQAADKWILFVEKRKLQRQTMP